MNKKARPQVKHVKLNGIEIHCPLPPYFISPDIATAMDDYGRYLDLSILEEKVILAPSRYLNEILARVGDTGTRRAEILQHYSQYVGSQKVLDQMEKAQALFKLATNIDTHYIRITDAANRSDLATLDVLSDILEQKFKKEDSFIIQKIKLTVKK